jgi:hypothetical protein
VKGQESSIGRSIPDERSAWPLEKGPHMGPKPDIASTATARRKLTEKMLRLDQMIDRQKPGSPERLALLRQQANLSDQREALVSNRL